MANSNTAGLKILFFSSTEFAVPTLDSILKSRHTLAAIITLPDKPKGRGRKIEKGILKEYASGHDIPCLDPVDLKDEDFLNQIKKIK